MGVVTLEQLYSKVHVQGCNDFRTVVQQGPCTGV